LDIKAIGTEFNVKAYSEEGTIETTLIEGEVEIVEKGVSEKNQTLVLKPNQKAIYTNKSDQLSLEEIRKIEPLAIKPAKIISEKLLISPKTDTDQAIAWTKDELIIKSENLETLCIKLQRKYDVKFVFNDEQVKKFRFNGTLLDETFEQVMEAIKLTAPIDYSVNGKTVILVTDKAQLHKYSVKNKE
jgi:ferric-dicitrate binding protein FerR (iron transport regulator)